VAASRENGGRHSELVSVGTSMTGAHGRCAVAVWPGEVVVGPNRNGRELVPFMCVRHYPSGPNCSQWVGHVKLVFKFSKCFPIYKIALTCKIQNRSFLSSKNC
jgi:hypothetical protein